MYREITENFAKQQAEKLMTTANKMEPAKTTPVVQSTRGLFGSYRDFLTKTDVQLTTTVLQGLHRRTVMFRITKKIVGDTLAQGYTVITGNDSADELCAGIDRIWGTARKMMSMEDSLVYGNSFDYLGYAVDNKSLVNIQELMVEYVTPKYNNDYTLQGIDYVSSEYNYLPEELFLWTYSRPKGEYFGIPLLMPAAAVLQLLLNSNTNVAILIDRFAMPIIHWMLDSGQQLPNGKKVKVTPEQITEFITSLKVLRSGEDLATDVGVNSKVLGLESSVWDFDQAIEFLNEQFHAICGVPAMLLGYGGTNKEISTRQMKMYYDTINSLQIEMGEQLIERLYRPHCARNGYLDLDMEIVFPTLEIEERSDRNEWVKSMRDRGDMTMGEGRVVMGLPHDKPEETQQQTLPIEAVNKSMVQTYNKPQPKV